MTGNSGPYLLYSAVRAKKILAKASAKDAFSERSLEPVVTGLGRSVNGPSPFMLRKSTLVEAERSLVVKLLEYKNVLDEAVREMAPHKVANYLYEVAQEFSRFYENCPVVGSDEEFERTKLVKVYFETMQHGLNILGIEIPEEM